MNVVAWSQNLTPGSPERRCINDDGKKAPNWGLFVRHQAWVGLSGSVSGLIRRERRLL